jgi:hypothetical protein
MTLAGNDYIDWFGKSGNLYRYWFADRPSVNATIKDKGGNFVFVMRLPSRNYIPLYFGQANSLRYELPNHERFAEAIRAGATHVMSHTTPDGEGARWVELGDLIRQWRPVLNFQRRQSGT